MPSESQLEQRLTQLRQDCKALRMVMNITDSDDSSSDIEREDTISEEDDFSGTDQDDDEYD